MDNRDYAELSKLCFDVCVMLGSTIQLNETERMAVKDFERCVDRTHLCLPTMCR